MNRSRFFASLAWARTPVDLREAAIERSPLEDTPALARVEPNGSRSEELTQTRRSGHV
jgi:hypothetical protein